MVKKLKSVLFALVLAALPSILLAGSPSVWPYGLRDQPPTTVTFAAGGLPLLIFVSR